MKRQRMAAAICVVIGVAVASFVFVGMHDGTVPPEAEAADGGTLSADVYVDDDADPGWYDETHVQTIQEGVNNALAGDTVLVNNGTYYENVDIDKTINLYSEHRNVTVIDGGGIGNVVKVTADDVTISGITVQNSGSFYWNAGIKLDGVQHCRIENTTASNNNDGIMLAHSSNCTITNVTASNNNEDGISLSSSSNCTITNTTANDNNWDGISLSSSSNCTITNVTASNNNEDGISLSSSSNCTITNTTVANNKWGIWLDSSSNCTLTNTTMLENGIYIWGESLGHWNTHTIDTSNTVNGKPVYYWKNKEGGTVPQDAGQIILANCTYVKVENQDVSNATIGIEIGFSPNCTITNTTASNNQWYGILLGSSSDCTITNATASNNGYGIWLWSSRNSTITDVTASNNGYGIWLESSSSDNFIFHNNFINNSQNAYEYGDNNTWYNATLQEGNYWDDYNGTDTDGDGIGDTPYNISGGDNQDMYPLMEPWNYTKEEPSADVYVDDDADPGWYDATHVGTIQEGVDNASAGDTVFVYNGTYQENVEIDKTINLFGGDRNGTVIDGGGSGDVINISSDEVTFNGFTVRDSGLGHSTAGIKIDAVQNPHIENINISNNLVGIWLDSTTHCTITNTTVGNNHGTGILLNSSTNCIITDNTVCDNDAVGIGLNSSTNCTITYSNMVNNALVLWGDTVDNWNTHKISNNTLNGEPVYYLKNISDDTVPPGAGQIILANCTDVKIENQNISRPAGLIRVGFSSGIFIKGINVSKTLGIWLSSSSYCAIINTT